MFGTIKIAGLSAILAAGIVTAIEVSQARESAPVAAKLYSDRVQPSDAGSSPPRQSAEPRLPLAELPLRAAPGGSKGDRLRDAADACATQTWPNIDGDCLVPVEGTPMRKAARTITIETREGANVSVLARVPMTEIARR